MMETNLTSTTDKFAKAHIKVRRLQDVMAEELKAEASTTNAELAEILWPWLIKQGEDLQKEVFTYAISHIRKVVEDKLNPRKRKNTKPVTDAQAAKLLQRYNAKQMLNMTYELLSAVADIGPKLQAKMQPGQRVKDVWKESQIVRMLKAG